MFPGWNNFAPGSARKRTSSPGTPGEGRGEGDFEPQAAFEIRKHTNPNPLPEYRERGAEHQHVRKANVCCAFESRRPSRAPDVHAGLVSSTRSRIALANRRFSCKLGPIATLLLVGFIQAFTAAQTTQPLLSDADQAIEGQSLRISDSDVKAATARPAASATIGTTNTDLTRIFVALLAVIGLILLLRAVYRRVSGVAGAHGGRLVTVLSRSFISPKQQVLVLEVGNRLLVVGDSGGHMNSLCEITDPDEIATLIGRSKSAAAMRASGAFASVFRRESESFEQSVTPAEVDNIQNGETPDEGVSTTEIGGLLDKVRQLQQQFNEAKQATANNVSTT
jgi:flagellar biogenesis protein FliO